MNTALVISHGPHGWTFRPGAELPVAALMLGKPVAEAAALLPRIFNLCGAAQSMAICLALGLPVPDPMTLRREILRDHVLKLCVIWPVLLGQPSQALPADWAKPAVLRQLIWGGDRLDFADWVGFGRGVAPVMRAIMQAFLPGEAMADVPDFKAKTAFEKTAQDNSVAVRHAHVPAMRTIEARFGRGPFWRAAGLVHDIEALLADVPEPQLSDSIAIVPAARGAYAVTASAMRGIVTAFDRRTPTDHLCAPGGVLQQSLNSLPVQKSHLLPLLIDILSPCVPVQLPQVQHA